MHAFDEDEVAPDAMQLLEVATFNGLCRVIAALAGNGLISSLQIRSIHECMTTPLDDPDWRDYPFVTDIRATLEDVLAHALAMTSEGSIHLGGGSEGP